MLGRQIGKSHKTYNMTALLIFFAKDIEIERVGVVVQRLVLDEKLRHQAQILTIKDFFLAIHLVHEKIAIAIDFVSRRMRARTYLGMLIQLLRRSIVFQAKFANIEFRNLVGLWIGGVIPALNLMTANLNTLDPLDLEFIEM